MRTVFVLEPWERKGKAGALAQSAKFAIAQSRHLCEVKTLTTSACLKHLEFYKMDNMAGMCLTAVHMKPFSLKERIRIDYFMFNY